MQNLLESAFDEAEDGVETVVDAVGDGFEIIRNGLISVFIGGAKKDLEND